MSTLTVDQVAVGYSNTMIINGLSVKIPEKKLQRLSVQMDVGSLHYLKRLPVF